MFASETESEQDLPRDDYEQNSYSVNEGTAQEGDENMFASETESEQDGRTCGQQVQQARFDSETDNVNMFEESGEGSQNCEEDVDDASDTDGGSTTSEELVPSHRLKVPLVLETQLDISEPHSYENRNVVQGTQLDFDGSENDMEEDLNALKVPEETDAQEEEFSGTFTRTQRRHLQFAIQQSLLASQPPQTPSSTAKQNPNCSVRRSPRLACSGTQSSAPSSSQSLAAQVISKHLSASKAPQRRCGTQLSIASFLLTSKRTSSTQDSVQGSQNSPEIVPNTSKKAKNTVPVTTPQLLLPPGSVIDIHEARALDYQMENHRIFMSQPENKEYLWLVFGRQRLNQLQAILESPNNTMQYLGDRFRVYDMI